MTKVNNLRFNNYLDSILRHGYRSVFDVYKVPGSKVKQAYAQYKGWCDQKKGTGFTVVNFNSHNMTLGYVYKANEKYRLAYITRDNDYDFELSQPQVVKLVQAGVIHE